MEWGGGGGDGWGRVRVIREGGGVNRASRGFTILTKSYHRHSLWSNESLIRTTNYTGNISADKTTK